MNDRITQKNSGFGLLEVVVATAMAGLLGLGVYQVMDKIFASEKTVKQKVQQREVTMTLRQHMMKPAACLNTFQGLILNPSGFELNQIKDAGNNIVLAKNGTDISKLLFVNKITMSNWHPDPIDAAQGRMDLSVFFSRHSNGGNLLRPDLITLYIRKSPANAILECYALGATFDTLAFDPIWTRNGPLDIYYMTGKVGIGMSTTVFDALTVSGNVFVQNAADKVMAHNLDIPAGSSAPIKLFETAVAANSSIDIAGGRVVVDLVHQRLGIGTSTPAAKLDVDGEIKFGNTMSPCSASNEGQQRYDAVQKLMQFCDGTSWKVYSIPEPKNCLGAFSPCYNGKRTYIIFRPADPTGDGCSNMPGDESTNGCS
jgi:hypothetical protein